MTTMPPEQRKAKEYLLEKGTRAPIAQIRERVADAFAAMDALLEGVSEAQARRAVEVLDHLVVTHPRALEEMEALLANRHSPVSPIPAGLRSAAPLTRSWADLCADLRRIHRQVLDVMAAAPDRATDARAPVIMVINVRDAEGRTTALHWEEPCDWKACAVIFRLHELDHLGQIRRLLRS